MVDLDIIFEILTVCEQLLLLVHQVFWDLEIENVSLEEAF